MKLSFLTKRTMSLAALFGAAFGAEVTTDWQPGICWDVNNQDSLNMIMYQCHGGSNQDFYYDSETAEIKVTSHPNTCMDYNLGSSNVYFFDCHGNSNQKWYYTQDTKEVKSVYNDYCLDYNYNDGNLYMSPCNGGANQRFNFPGGFFQALSTNSGDVPDFCWKDAYGRGVGTIPDGCPEGREKIGLLCYSSCPAGMYRWGFDCHASCPDGFRDEGLFCRRDAYGRGAGYPAWDWGRCESDNGAGNCEWWGALIYPKCAEGYTNSACCICSPNDIDCNSFPGMSEVPDFASCAKQIIIGDPTPMTCPAGKENSGGLCYDPCSPGYWGAGPVCWGQVPPSMVDCGMGAASNGDNCVQAISDQIQSVFELTLFVATAGTSGAAKEGVETDQKSQFAKLCEDINTIMDIKAEQELQEDLRDAVVNFATYDYNALHPEDIARMSAELVSLFDPTGVSSVVAAYTYAKCSAYFN